MAFDPSKPAQTRGHGYKVTKVEGSTESNKHLGVGWDGDSYYLVTCLHKGEPFRLHVRKDGTYPYNSDYDLLNTPESRAVEATEPPRFDPTLPFRTRNGRDVTEFEIDADEDYPFFGMVVVFGYESWGDDGKVFKSSAAPHPHDLINLPAPLAVEERTPDKPDTPEPISDFEAQIRKDMLEGIRARLEKKESNNG